VGHAGRASPFSAPLWVHLSAVSVVPGQGRGIPRALLRDCLLALVIPALIMDRERRGPHDRAAGRLHRRRPLTPAQYVH
jgi:hypothetical protein